MGPLPDAKSPAIGGSDPTEQTKPATALAGEIIIARALTGLRAWFMVLPVDNLDRQRALRVLGLA